MAQRILIVDDEDLNLVSTKYVLAKWGYEPHVARSGDEAIAKLREGSTEFAVILLDYRMPGKTGAETAKEIRTFNDECRILMYSGDDSRDAIKEALLAGVDDFIEKGVDVDFLQQKIKQWCDKFEKNSRTVGISSKTKTTAEELISSIGMVGRSRAMADVAMKVMQFREQNRPVLILGETGSGKELIAKALHVGSPDTFCAVNCAAYADKPQLLESELFGYEKGAFTGALAPKAGIFQVAKTVFLDELPFLDASSQAKLLRALQEHKIRRVGSNHEVPVNFRLIAAAKPDLEQRVANNQFSADFFYRLNYLRIEVPALHERPEDIEPLVELFTERYCKESGQRKAFLVSTVRLLERYTWPGNVRELESYVYRLLVESKSKRIDPSQLDGRFKATQENSAWVTLEELEQRHEEEKAQLVRETLRTSASTAHAAQRLRIRPTTLYSFLNRNKTRA